MAGAPATEYGVLADAVYERDAVGFVHVARPRDPTMRYIARVDGPRSRMAFVFVNGDALLVPPASHCDAAKRQFAGDAIVDPASLSGDGPGERAAELLGDRADPGTVLTPRHVPHDAALFLERAGFDPASTEAVDRARETKSSAEIDRIRRVQRGAEAGVRVAAEVLAGAAVDGREIRDQGGSLTTGGLRRRVNAALAERGLEDAGNTVVAAGRAAASPRFGGDVPIRPGEPVIVDVTPRGGHGYHVDFARTFVVDSDGGWDRRAHVAVEQALQAGIDAVEPGASPATVHRAVAGEIRSFGFPADRSRDVGFVHDAVHGVGLARREAPSVSGGPLEPGHVLAVEAGVYDPAEGGVRLEEPVVVGTDGVRRTTEATRSLEPAER
ncbi:MAG: M24 family metallopeptidase [Halanaeroarchaeum sp.]